MRKTQLIETSFSFDFLVIYWLTEPVVGVYLNDGTNFRVFFKTHWNARNTYCFVFVCLFFKALIKDNNFT